MMGTDRRLGTGFALLALACLLAGLLCWGCTDGDAPEQAAPEDLQVSTGASSAKAGEEQDPFSFSIDVASIPEYSGKPWVELNGNQPFFNPASFKDFSGEYYSELDSLGRCGTCVARVSKSTVPTQERGDISGIKPTGWKVATYDWIEHGYLYNRCHLLGYQLTAENANERNLITGTRYLNIDGMQPFENKVAYHLESTGGDVLLRVTPIFQGNDLLARGVVMEAYSPDDEGASLSYCVFCYNVQPGVGINYENGDSWADGSLPAGESEAAGPPSFILNTYSFKFHRPNCEAVYEINEWNKKDFYGSAEEAMAQGYSPCNACHPERD